MAIPFNPARQISRYWLIDGLPELWLGIYGMMIGGLLLVAHYAAGSIWASLVWLALSLVNLSTFPARRLITAIKLRLTYPRTGYVEYAQELTPRQWQRVLKIAAVIGLATIILVVALTPTWMRVAAPQLNAGPWAGWMLLLTAAVSGLLITLGWYCNLPRFYVVAAATATVGLCVSLMGPIDYLGGALVIMTASIGELISGALTLYRYLKQNPITEQAYDEART